jgi:hypothetical protein
MLAMAIDPTDIWPSIPPEEKVQLMNRAQARGVGYALLVIVVACTLAICLQDDWLMWGSIIGSPLVYQAAAGKAWRDLRPRIILEYLAARSAARRYAFSNASKDLTLLLMFRGELKTEYPDQPAGEGTPLADQEHVWIALFSDTLVIMAEEPGGAALRMAHPLNERLGVAGISPAGKGEYDSEREVRITEKNRNGLQTLYRLTSQSPAALIVLEKKIITIQGEYRKTVEDTRARIAALEAGKVAEIGPEV